MEQAFDVVNLSLSTTRRRFAGELHALADQAYFMGTVVVAAAHNTPVESFPWRFASVVSVGSHAVRDPSLVLLQPLSASRVLRLRHRCGGGLARR